MAIYRTVPIFDPRAQPQSWSNRTVAGEYAAMLTDARNGAPCDETGLPVADINKAPCFIFPDLPSANAWCAARVQEYPEIRCRIYDADGLAKPPAAEHVDPKYVRRDPLNRKVSRRIGIALVTVGATLFVVEWISDFSLSWAAMIGARLLPVGVILLVTELAFVADDVRKRRASANAGR